MSYAADVTGTKEELISYQKLRAFIGITGILLPILLQQGCYWLVDKEASWQISISHYYYSRLHIIYVAMLCMLAGFLITYTGKKDEVWESRISNLAGYFALANVIFPTQFEGFRCNSDGDNQYIHLFPMVSKTFDIIHFVFAALLFTCFAIFCLKFFQRPDRNYTCPTDLVKFELRKRLYKICGVGILSSMAFIFIFFQIRTWGKDIWPYSTVFFETTALWFFGTAWLVKGSAVFKNVLVLSRIVEPFR